MGTWIKEGRITSKRSKISLHLPQSIKIWKIIRLTELKICHQTESFALGIQAFMQSAFTASFLGAQKKKKAQK